MLGPGILSWAALYLGGFHPALALVPIVRFMPHSAADLGLFDRREEHRPDTLNRFEHWWATPVQFVLLLFGFANAGVQFEQIGPGTYYVLAALLLGKPLGIVLFSSAARAFGGSLPPGFCLAELFVVGIAASIGFTVSLFLRRQRFRRGVYWPKPRWAPSSASPRHPLRCLPLASFLCLRIPGAPGPACIRFGGDKHHAPTPR